MKREMLSFRMWVKTMLPALFIVLLVASLLLNRNAVVEPGIHVVFARYERPALLPVLLPTLLAGVALGSVVRTAFTALRHLRESRGRFLAAPLKPEAVGIK